MPDRYDVTIITLQPGTHGRALSILKDDLSSASNLLACWYSELGALNRILIIRRMTDTAACLDARAASLASGNPFGIGDLIAGMTMNTFTALDFVPPMKPGESGPCYEVRTYALKVGGLTPTVELWRKWVPGRARVSPLLAAMTSVSGTVTRLMHIWPYKTLDERVRLRAKSIADGVWPPPGGAVHFAAQQTDIYLPAPFSPLR